MEVAPFHRRRARATPTPASVSRDALDNGDTVRIEGVDYPDYPAIAEGFCRAVVEKRVSFCQFVVMACRRYLDMLDPQFQRKKGFYFSPEHAIEVCAFIESLHHVKGTKAGETLVLDPYQIWMECAIYGFRWADTGLRVVNTVYVELPRKHGKSLIAAGNGLYEVTVNAFRGDDLYIIAPKFEQGLKVLEPTQKMAKENPALEQFFDIRHTQKRSRVEKTDSNIIVLASLGEKEDGHDPKTVIADEFHAVPRAIYEVMKSAQRARPESMFWQMGSAGRHTFGVGWDERRGAIDVLKGKVEQLHLFAVIFTIDPEDFVDWHTERVIRKANPGIGSSVDLRKTLQEAAEARGDPVKRFEFLRTALNQWGLSEQQLFPAEKWARSRRPMKLTDMKGRRGWIGIDLASRNDMIACVTVFEEATGGVRQINDELVPDVELFVFASYFVPELGPWREDEDLKGVYQAWRADGHLTFTPGSWHRYNELKDLVLKIEAEHEIELILVDDHEANEIFSFLQGKGKPVQSFRKNAPNFSDPTRDIMARVNGEEVGLFHDGNPILAWNMQNVIGGFDTSDRILGKKPAPNSNQKIDGFDCLVMCNAARLQSLTMPVVAQSASVVDGIRKW